MASTCARACGVESNLHGRRKTPPISQYLRNVANGCDSASQNPLGLVVSSPRFGPARASAPEDTAPLARDLRAQDLRAQDLRAQDLRARDLRAMSQAGAAPAASWGDRRQGLGEPAGRGVMDTPQPAAPGRGKPRRAGRPGPYWPRAAAVAGKRPARRPGAQSIGGSR